ncbi:MAG: hypothetical protein NPIRA02_41430 [Nitrospirales bacterium]|nr:MAG: hypothetical protein NPIRA02_41430 [Nitrospirales bacterium]
MTHTALTALLTGIALCTGLAVTDNVEARNWHKRNNVKIQNVIEATDLNNKTNPTVQPQDPALSGDDRDQTLRSGDILRGTHKDDLIIGKLGPDILVGNYGNDVMIGGTEDFSPFNQDRAFGGHGRDIFMWAPGDGSDQFEGGKGADAVMFGLIGEIGDDQNITFAVDLPGTPDTGDSDPIFLSPKTNLPLMNASGSPGFCEIIDGSNADGGQAALDALNVDHLVKFFIRAAADTFESGAQNTDNGLRVTLHLKDVEVVVCTNREGGLIQAYDLTHVPAQPIDVDDIRSRTLRNRIKAIVF